MGPASRSSPAFRPRNDTGGCRASTDLDAAAADASAPRSTDRRVIPLLSLARSCGLRDPVVTVPPDEARIVHFEHCAESSARTLVYITSLVLAAIRLLQWNELEPGKAKPRRAHVCRAARPKPETPNRQRVGRGREAEIHIETAVQLRLRHASRVHAPVLESRASMIRSGAPFTSPSTSVARVTQSAPHSTA